MCRSTGWKINNYTLYNAQCYPIGILYRNEWVRVCDLFVFLSKIEPENAKTPVYKTDRVPSLYLKKTIEVICIGTDGRNVKIQRKVYFRISINFQRHFKSLFVMLFEIVHTQ